MVCAVLPCGGAGPRHRPWFSRCVPKRVFGAALGGRSHETSGSRPPHHHGFNDSLQHLWRRNGIWECRTDYIPHGIRGMPKRVRELSNRGTHLNRRLGMQMFKTMRLLDVRKIAIAVSAIAILSFFTGCEVCKNSQTIFWKQYKKPCKYKGKHPCVKEGKHDWSWCKCSKNCTCYTEKV